MALDIPDDDMHAVMVCHRPEHLNGTPSPGSRIEHCFQCGHDIWFATSSDQVKANAEARGLTFVTACCCCAEMHTGDDIVQLAGRDEVQMHLTHTFKDGVCTACGITEDNPDDIAAREAREHFAARIAATHLFAPRKGSNG